MPRFAQHGGTRLSQERHEHETDVGCASIASIPVIVRGIFMTCMMIMMFTGTVFMTRAEHAPLNAGCVLEEYMAQAGDCCSL